jgi:hypothetical protein
LSSWSRAALAAALAATLGGWLVAALTPRDFGVGNFADDAQYAVLAKSIRVEHAYRNLNLPGRPAETKYPPLWPAVLASAWKPGLPDAQNLARLRWVNLALLGPLAGILAVAGMRTFGLPPAAAAAAAVTGLAAPAAIRWWAIPMSEPLCLGLVVAGLALAETGRFRTGAAVTALAVYARSLAAPFLLAVPLVCAWKHGWRRALWPAVLGFGLLVPWAVQVVVHSAAVPAPTIGAYGSYGRWYLESLAADPATVLFTVPWKNAPRILWALGEGLTGWWSAPRLLQMAVGIGVAILVARAARTRPVLAVGLVLYVLAMLAWPFPQEDRFGGSVWPMLLLAALAGARSAARPGDGRRRGRPGARGGHRPPPAAQPRLDGAAGLAARPHPAGDRGGGEQSPVLLPSPRHAGRAQLADALLPLVSRGLLGQRLGPGRRPVGHHPCLPAGLHYHRAARRRGTVRGGKHPAAMSRRAHGTVALGGRGDAVRSSSGRPVHAGSGAALSGERARTQARR